MKLAIFVQARITSKRFPKKILAEINGNKIIEILIAKLKKIKHVDKIVILIPNTKKNKELSKLLEKLNIEVFKGSEKNVLERFYFAAVKFKAKNIIRITADCPLIDIKIINKTIKRFFSGDYDYATNTMPPTFPDGLDCEIFKFSALKESWRKAKTPHQKEHVTPYIRNMKKFKKVNILNKFNQKEIRLTIDWKKDLVLIKKIFNHFKPKIDFDMNEINILIKKYPKWFEINKKYNVR